MGKYKQLGLLNVKYNWWNLIFLFKKKCYFLLDLKLCEFATRKKILQKSKKKFKLMACSQFSNNILYFNVTGKRPKLGHPSLGYTFY